MTTATSPALSPPSWPYCAHVADPNADPVGCRGIRVPGQTSCLAHLSDTDRGAYLAGLTPGASIDHRGTSFPEDLLDQLLSALRDPTTGELQVGTAKFDEAQFTGPAAAFSRAQFSGSVRFNGAHFCGDAEFLGVQFSGDAEFTRAQFSGLAWFSEAQFSGKANFIMAQFSRPAGFLEAKFTDAAVFNGAKFTRDATYHSAQFSGDASFHETLFAGDNADFSGARFEAKAVLGPLVCAGAVKLSSAVFKVPVMLEIAAREVRCERTWWESTATLRVRYGNVNLGHAVLSAPVAVIAHPVPFSGGVGIVDESLLAGCHDGVRMASIQGADAAHLVLTDIDLTDCLFFGAFHLDQLRLEGRTTFAPTPTGWHRRGVLLTRWTPRRTLAEEHHWRAQVASQPALPPGHSLSPRQWRPSPHHPAPLRASAPEDVTALYRQLRKALEDGMNEPGAADFYYGECEMRRHDHTGTSKSERGLLWGYWLLSGYGLRASRAFTSLFIAMSLTVLLLMAVGLPTHDPNPATTGALHGSKISLSTKTPDPALHGPWSQRMTWARAEKATRIAVNSVVFRSSGQNLTAMGTYIEMASRLLEPTLLALGALAIRGRIKR
ncbi:pentapeptide repeat-containing protein [Streptomyces sp. NPDC004682]